MRFRFALLSLLIYPCLAQDAARMEQVMQSYVAGHFMGSVLVARGSQVLLSKGYGSADLEWDIPNSPNTKFRLGSLTKQFTAASILLLEERGKLSVNDLVKKYIPDAPPAWDKITIYYVLTHTAGLPNYTSFPDYAKLEPFASTSRELVARFKDKPLDFEPGERYRYSNSGYVLLGYLIEKITGASYETFLRENIFTPLGMKDSGYDSTSAIIAHRASGYVFTDDKFENSGFVHMSTPHAAGALYSTTGDLLKWEQGLFGGKVLQPKSFEKMTTPFKNNYGFGLNIRTVNGHKEVEHTGGINGFSTDMAYYPDDKLTVVVLTNMNGGPAPSQVASKLAAVGLGETVTLTTERKEITVDPKALGRYVGAYKMPGGVDMVITLDNRQLISKLGAQPPIAIFPESETAFFLKTIDAQLEFSKDASQVTLHQNGRDQVGKRMDEAESKRLTDAAAAATLRIKNQTANPGSEAVVRAAMEQLRAGNPDYDRMNPGLAAVTRQQLPGIQSRLIELGPLQSATFKGVAPNGADIYQLKFENGSFEYRIVLGLDGKVEAAAMGR
jgi:CubicO group peptidase (beta-lactamase class C family)